MTIKDYHSNSKNSKAKKWIEACHRGDQGLTFAGVTTHHQNGMAERRIRELQELTCTLMVHYRRRWYKEATENICSYALCMANNLINEITSFKKPDKKRPQSVYSGYPVVPNSKHWKISKCPIYVIDSALQSTQPHQNWSEKSRVGVYLGTSLIHSKNVTLVLSLNSGLVSPKFQVNFDKKIQTVIQQELPSQRQPKVGLIALRGGRPLSATSTPMQKIERRNPHPEKMNKKLKRYELRKKETDSGMRNWVKTQGDR